ncbi:MAG TPA: cell division protein FtsQ/DivIB [Burkholderiales bacterium]
MWDNPRLLNLAANALYGVAAFIVLCIAVIAIVNSQLFPLRTVSVRGAPQHVDAAAIERALAGRVTGNFFGVDLVAVRDAMESVPWVRRVEVRRHWPDTIVVKVEEHEALARWRDEQLVNTHGELFEGQITADLPRFSGPSGTEAAMTAHYREFAQRVAALGMRITSIELSPRHAWELKLAGEERGLTIMLGREQVQYSAADRLQRFVEMYPTTVGLLHRNVGDVDLRYPNGFALRVPGLEKLDSKNKKAGSA